MNTVVGIGSASRIVADRAIIVHNCYGAAVDDYKSRVFATVHSIVEQDGTPALGPGELLTMQFLTELARALGTRLKPEILPPNVLCRTPHVIAWWTPAQTRVMYFRRESKLGALNGWELPVPPLVWRIAGRVLHVRALRTSARPAADAPLYIAPFWNTNNEGHVCQGSMARPASVSIETLDGWVDGYFGSEFTHDYGNRRLTTHPKGFAGLWNQLANHRRTIFPPEYLTDAKQTLIEFVQGKDAQDSEEFAD